MQYMTKQNRPAVPVPAPLYPYGHPEGVPAAAGDVGQAGLPGQALPAPASACKSEAAGLGMGRLFLLTTLPAVDGGILVLAATGRLSSFWSAAVVGLTMIAGAGAWIAARDAFGTRPWTLRNWASLLVLGAVTVIATVAAAWLGSTLGQAVTLHVLPKVAGIAMCLIGAEIAGVRFPRPVGLPLPVVAVAAGVLAEVVLQWTP